MGATAVASGSAGGASPLVSVGLGAGGIAASLALVYLLAYFDVLSAKRDADRRVHWTLGAMAIPLVVTFLGIVAFNAEFAS
ncbi:hypothetical protein [Halosimplex salinum]|uniref:hypothetical protein n=1 Tax=Halosimplex salinum TaxID=1710538 RepID=UPI000F475CBC|nr:hypothetical protein [Halosimplex salinum]